MNVNCLRRAVNFFDNTFFCAILSAVLYLVSFRLSFLIWIVPALWTFIIRQGRCVYSKIWLAGVVFWLATFSWMCPHDWWVKASWVALSSSLALFWVFFVGLSRVAVHRLGVPVIFAAPIVWCGLEWFRKNWFFGGFSLASLEHTQYENTTIIQFADIFGEYGVGLLIIFVGACLGRLLPGPGRSSGRIFAVAGCMIAVISALLYGQYRLSLTASNQPVWTIKVALLQGTAEETTDRSYAQYKHLSQEAARNADIVVWPEASCCTLPFYHFQSDFVPDNWKNEPVEDTKKMLQETLDKNHAPFVALAAETPVLLGVITSLFGSAGTEDCNSAVLVDKFGVGPRYDKVHLIPVAEYNPLPGLIADTGHPSFTPGDLIPAFPIRSHQSQQLWAAVNICYDSSFPHFIRKQVRNLTEEGKEPDVLINLSNDVLFHSSQSDLHLATHVFRAIENRKPYLSATEAGHSVWIDSTGRIVKKGERGDATYVVAEIWHEPSESLYLYWGDWFPICCAGFNGFVSMCWFIACPSACAASPSAALGPAKDRSSRR
jgi:apolipoprotein N-acyltransferase